MIKVAQFVGEQFNPKPSRCVKDATLIRNCVTLLEQKGHNFAE
ncbi:MAG: hypothetical protein WCJ03_01280 [Bacteroidales bacterium]